MSLGQALASMNLSSQALARAGAVAAILCHSACSFTPAPSLPEPVAGLPDSFEGSGESHAHRAREWWTTFQDPVLNAVVDSVMAANFDLAEAVARVQQARAQAGIARAGRLPAINATASLSETDNPSNVGLGQQFSQIAGDLLPADTARPGGGRIEALPTRLETRTWSLGASFAYELDFWGRARNDARSAGLGYLASESDYDAARIGVLAETISTYFEIVDLRRRAVLAREAVDLLLEREELTDSRYGRGLVTSQDLYRARQDLWGAQSALPRIESRLVNAEGRLAVLAGGFRDKLRAILTDSLAPLPSNDPVSTGVPADLLAQRPDVRAAGLRLDAARFRIGARRAEMLPSLSFSGIIGVQSVDAGELFDVGQWFSNLIGNLTTPIFGRGRIRGNIAHAQARFALAAAAYGRAVVTAVHEVEAALVALDNEGRRHEFLMLQREDALASVALQSRRYAAGVGSYIEYLDAARALLGVESTLAGGRRDLALARLALHRALGGDWTAPPEEADGPRMVPVSGSRERVDTTTGAWSP